MAGGRIRNRPDYQADRPGLDQMPGFTDRDRLLMRRMQGWLDQGQSLDTFAGGRDRWQHHDRAMGLWNQWQTFQSEWTAGQNKPPETWLTRRRGYMGRRYTSTPEGGFSGALGGAAVQRKRLLGA